jgi:hypothetical protein
MDCQKLANSDTKNPILMDVLLGLERGQVELLNKPMFLAGIYMDPRFNFFGSTVLTTEQQKIAEVSKLFLELK